MRSADWSSARNVLCVRLDNIGDLLMTTPAVRALKESVPGRRVTLLVSSACAEAASHVPEADAVLAYDAPWMKASDAGDAAIDRAMVRRLASMGFDAAAIFTVFSQNPLPAAHLCYLADIPLRLAHCRENPYRLLTDWVPDPEPERLVRHEVRRQLDLVAAIGARAADERLSLRVSGEARRKIRGFLAEKGFETDRPWVVMHPGATAPSRRYPAEGFASAARTLSGEDGWPVVFSGGPAETELVESIRALAGGRTYSSAGQLDFAELAALIEAAPLLIANNTGAAHVAAAVGTPVVDLYALTNPQHFPWRVPHRTLFHDVPCRFCYKSVCPEKHNNCLRLVSADAVVQAARELLRGHPKRRTP